MSFLVDCISFQIMIVNRKYLSAENAAPLDGEKIKFLNIKEGKENMKIYIISHGYRVSPSFNE